MSSCPFVNGIIVLLNVGFIANRGAHLTPKVSSMSAYSEILALVGCIENLEISAKLLL